MTAFDPKLAQAETARRAQRSAQHVSDLLDGYYQPQPAPASAREMAQQDLAPLAQMFAYYEA